MIRKVFFLVVVSVVGFGSMSFYVFQISELLIPRKKIKR